MNSISTGFTKLFVVVIAVWGLGACSTANTNTAENVTVTEDLSLDTVISGVHRSSEAKARDPYRHPRATLEFFELKADQTVVELLPGGGWYTDIIAPFVASTGQYYGAGYALDVEGQPEYRYRLGKAFEKKLNGNRALYGAAQITVLAPPAHTDIAPAGSADLVVTFRNFHGFLREDPALVMDAVVKALKPGGLFGVVQHRATEDRDRETMKTSGYVSEQVVIDYATAAGLELLDRSEVNANAQDSTDHPKGVWTLPPNYRLGEEDRAKYQAIGESDRMTLKFRKPL